jgi:hypothetical protein
MDELNTARILGGAAWLAYAACRRAIVEALLGAWGHAGPAERSRMPTYCLLDVDTQVRRQESCLQPFGDSDFK